MSWLLVVLGAMVGAPLRFVTDLVIQSRRDTVFPWGTMAVNVVGSFVLGVVVGAASDPMRLLLGTGFSGALTTYSTFSYETLRLAEEGAGLLAVANVVVSVVVGVGAAVLGVVASTAVG